MSYTSFDLKKFSDPATTEFRMVPTSKSEKETFSKKEDKATVAEAQIQENKLTKEITDVNTLMPDFYRNGYYEYDSKGNSKYRLPPLNISERDYYKAENIATISFMNFGKNIIPPTAKFFLKSVNMSDNEKYHLYETNSQWFINFFGEKPTIYNFNIALLNDSNFNWYNEFMYLYQMVLRGTKAAEHIARVHIRFGFEEVSGFILGNTRALDSQFDKIVDLSFPFAVVKREILTTDEDSFSDSFLKNIEALNALIKKLNPTAKKGSPEYNAVASILNKKVSPSHLIENKKSNDYVNNYWKNATKGNV